MLKLTTLLAGAFLFLTAIFVFYRHGHGDIYEQTFSSPSSQEGQEQQQQQMTLDYIDPIDGPTSIGEVTISNDGFLEGAGQGVSVPET